MKISVFYTLVKILTLLVVTTFSVHASEGRTINDGRFYVNVGWKLEPAFEDVANGLNISITEFDEYGIPRDVNTALGDRVNLKATVFFLESDTFDANVISSVELKEPLNLSKNQFNRYVSNFKPTHDGAYGFRVAGTINDIFIDETFICGGGTKSIFGDSLHCVVDPQAFPGNMRGNNGSQKDKAGYKDNDKFSLAE